MNAVDTNVLFCARDPRDPRKQAIAIDLISSLRDGVLMWQVACEYLAVSRKLVSFGYSRTEAVADIMALSRLWKPALPAWSALNRADDLRVRFRLSFWDSLLIAGCIEAKVSRLYSEDLQHGAVIDSVEIVNPFQE